jgi:glycosyltransferase involved in cell wall biosynthesis
MSVFVTNRPNYCHRRFAESVGCDFYYVKHPIPESIPILSLPINGFFNSRRLPDADLYFSESMMDYYPVFYKGMGKKVVLLAEDTIFKLKTMSGLKKKYLLRLFRSADGFMAVSPICKRMLLEIVDRPVRVAYPFPHEDFSSIKSAVGGKNVLFIGRDDRTKGFPELIEAIKILRIKDPAWNLYLIGQCGDRVAKSDGIHPLGYVKDMKPFMKKCSFLVHPARFDPCPATIFEAMDAGMITVISKNIGQADIFMGRGMKDLVLDDISPEAIATKLYDLSERSNAGLSRRLKKLGAEFHEKDRLKIFKKEFAALVGEV